MHMRNIVVVSITLIAACSSSPNEAVDGPTNDPGGTGGDLGGAGTNASQAAAGGNTTGSGGIVGAGGKATGGGAGGATDRDAGARAGSDAASGDSANGVVVDTGAAKPPSPCSAMPSREVWENISPVKVVVGDTTGKNYAESVVVDPFDPAIVWAGTNLAGVFKSTNCGAPGSFVHVNTGKNGDQVDKGGVSTFQVDPKHAGVLYVNAFAGPLGLWKSTNWGVDWTQLFPADSELAKVVPGAFVNTVAMDPNDTLHLVVSMHQTCNPPYGPVCEAESTDGGQSWKITTVPVGSKEWVGGEGAFILSSTSWLFGTFSYGLWLTTDSGASFRNVTPAGATGAMLGKTLVLPFYPNELDHRYYLSAIEGILRSTGSDGQSWQLIPNSGGRSLGFAMGDGHFYSADPNTPTYHTATFADPTMWSPFPAPTGIPSDAGAYALAIDRAHHILYSANYAGGLWRMVTQ
jgi:hypothetical protein